MVLQIERNISEERDRLDRIASWSDMSLFNSFRNLAGILCGPSIEPGFKEEIILKTSILSFGFIKND